MKYFVDHYLVAVIFIAIAIYSGLQIWKIRKQKKAKGGEEIPAPVVREDLEEVIEETEE